MAWKESVSAARRALRQEAGRLETELVKTRTLIRDLERVVRKPPKHGSRRLSPAGREAISRAAKKRWAAYRRAQR